MFNVKPHGKVSMLNLVKAANKLSCHIGIEFVKDDDISLDNCEFSTIKMGDTKIAAYNLEDSVIDAVIEFIDENYTIVSMDIDDEKVDEKSTSDTNTEIVFDNEKLNGSFEKLRKTVDIAVHEKNVAFSDIQKYIDSFIRTIKMRFEPKEAIEISVGDIVKCDYGENLDGETNGIVNSIVCSVYKDGAYVLPIIWMPKIIFSKFFVVLKKEQTINGKVKGNILLAKGKFVNEKRILSIEDRITNEAFEELEIKRLAAFSKKEITN